MSSYPHNMGRVTFFYCIYDKFQFFFKFCYLKYGEAQGNKIDHLMHFLGPKASFLNCINVLSNLEIYQFFLIFTTFKNNHNSKILKEIQEQLFRLAMWPMSLSIVFVVVPVVFVFIVAIVFVEVCLVNGCYNVYLFKIVLLLYLYCCSVFVVPVFVDVVIFFLLRQLFIRYNRTSLHTYSNKRKLVNEVDVQHEPHYECKVFNQ